MYYLLKEYESKDGFCTNAEELAIDDWRIHSWHRRDFFHDSGRLQSWRETYTVLYEKAGESQEPKR